MSVPAQEIRPCRLPGPFQPTILERNFKAWAKLVFNYRWKPVPIQYNF